MQQIRNNVPNVSEVARLKQRLDAECLAAHQAMYGFAEVGKHERITKRLEIVGKVHQELVRCVGEKEATETLAKAMDVQ